MIGFLSFLVGLLLGLFAAILFAGYGIIEVFSDKLDEAKETIETCNELLTSIEDRVIEVKAES